MASAGLRRTPLPRPRAQRYRRHGRNPARCIPLARSPGRSAAALGRRIHPRIPQPRGPLLRDSRRRRYRAITQRHPRRHRRHRYHCERQSCASLWRVPWRHPLCQRNPRRLGRHAGRTSSRKEAAASSASPSLLSRSSYRSRSIPARAQAGFRHDRHQRRTLHRSWPHLR